MKTLFTSLSLILMLTATNSAFAEVSEEPLYPEANIETVLVVAVPEVANFEIFSEKHSAKAIDQAMNIVVDNLKSKAS